MGNDILDRDFMGRKMRDEPQKGAGNMNLTVISKHNMEFLKGEEKTAKEIVDFLNQGAMYRNFEQVLGKVYPGEDLKERLEQGMVEVTGDSRDSIVRKVSNWVKGRNIPKNRETLFQICFVLGLDEKGASQLLGTASETGIHYREPKEVVYAFGLRTGLGYKETAELYRRIEKDYFSEPGKMKGNSSPVYTRMVRDAFAQVEKEEELMEFFEEHGREMGQFHETAYKKFMELLNHLQKPGSVEGQEEKYTMKEVVELYIRMNVPQTKKLSDYSLLQKLVKKYWPGETALLNMQNRREDVGRKTMILLYLATEEFDGCGDPELYFYDEEEEEDADTVLEARLEKMNLFLDSYGMNGLDPGNPFDFLVLYAMRTQEGDFASDRMSEVLGLLFQEEYDGQTKGPQENGLGLNPKQQNGKKFQN